MSVIHCPSPDDRVELSNEVACCGLQVPLNDFSDFLKKVSHALPGRLDEELSPVFAYILSEKVKTILNMRDARLFFRELETAFPHEPFYQRLHRLFQDLFRCT